MPASLAHMDGFGSQTFSFWNNEGERYWVKWHFKTEQGIRNMGVEEAAKIAAENPDYHRQELYAAAKKRLVDAMQGVPREIQERRVAHFTRADPD